MRKKRDREEERERDVETLTGLSVILRHVTG